MYATGDPISVLHVDDDPDFADLTATVVERTDDRFSVETATNAGDGLERFAADGFDCIVSDYDMPGRNGIEFLETVREDDPDVPFILFTGEGSEEVASDAISAGATDYLRKGGGTERYELLANRIRNAVEQYRHKRRRETLERIRATVNDVNQALLRASSREEIETRICEILAGTDPYRFAVVAEVDGGKRSRSAHVGRHGRRVSGRLRDECRRGQAGSTGPWRTSVSRPRGRRRPEHSVGPHLRTVARPGARTPLPGARRRSAPVRVRPVRAPRRLRRPSARVRRHRASGPRGTRRRYRSRDTRRRDPARSATERAPVQGRVRGSEDARRCTRHRWNADTGQSNRDGLRRGRDRRRTRRVLLGDAVVGDDMRDDIRRWIERAKTGEYVEYEADLSRTGGGRYSVDGTIRPVTDSAGEVVSLVVSARDITDQKSYERRIETLHTTTRDVVEVQTAEAIAGTVVSAVDDVLDMPVNAVYRYDESEQCLAPIAWTDRAEGLVGELPTFRPGDGLAWDVFETGEGGSTTTFRRTPRA